MSTIIFFQKITTYTPLSPEAQHDWTQLLKPNHHRKGTDFLPIGQVPKKVAFVVKGLFAQQYTSAAGDTIIKHFFSEGRIAGSIPATLTQTESTSSITALEDTDVLEYDFHAFKKLVEKHRDIAEFYIRYMEQHWVIGKEPYEISLRSDSAKVRYHDFVQRYPELIKRIKKHHMAAYLGITPTQLSRIFFANK